MSKDKLRNFLKDIKSIVNATRKENIKIEEEDRARIKEENLSMRSRTRNRSYKGSTLPDFYPIFHKRYQEL